MIQKLFSGIDMVEIDRFRALNPQILERFYQRVYTKDERRYIASSFERAAGIFAAKEALAKALGCGIGQVSWQEIGIRYDKQGKPMPELSGEAKAAEQSLEISGWSLSISHTKENAVAVAIALASTDEQENF
jgi:holo-[acyl-carrier protein] synthase